MKLKSGSLPSDTLLEARRRASMAQTVQQSVLHEVQDPLSRKEKKRDKTTKLLTTILALFLLAEFPQVKFLSPENVINIS